MSKPDYTTWSHSQLIERVTELERRLKEQTASFKAPSPSPPSKKVRRPPKTFDPSKYSTRLIALKFAYLGQNYNGYEHHANNTTPLPTVEEELWKALVKTRLIFPTSKAGSRGDSSGSGKQKEPWEEEVNWEGCEYSKCGRTDRGVSAFGQVIGIRLRSNRPLRTRQGSAPARVRDTSGESEIVAGDLPTSAAPDSGAEQDGSSQEDSFDPIKDELPYIQLLNRVLPADIRVLAWCPNPPPGFSARFSCKERRYRYFFTQPAFLPVPHTHRNNNSDMTNGSTETTASDSRQEGYLDITAMRRAASHYIGLHDFRNFCKVDPAKQITNFERRVFHASIDEISSLPLPSFLTSPSTPAPRLYCFTVHGSAFLWHQVRHLVAVLFLVGQGLEKPEVVQELLDMERTPRKPKYEMAADAPLVLWDCLFPAVSGEEGGEGRSTVSRPDALEWVYVEDESLGTGKGRGGEGDGKWGRGGVMEDLWRVWRRRKMDEVLAGLLLDVAAGKGSMNLESNDVQEPSVSQASRSTKIFDGSDAARLAGKYVPIMQKEKMESVEVINARYAERKGLDKREIASRSADDGDE